MYTHDVHAATGAHNIYKQEEADLNIGANHVPLEEICSLSKRVQSDEEEVAVREEWKSVADRFNKLFLILFIAMHTTVVLICFAILPHVR